MARGILSEQVKTRSKQLFGYKINQLELRLMPYIQYQMMNEQRLDPNKISPDERDVLAKWREAGYITGGAGGLSITREFWDIINDICFIAYVEKIE